MLYHLKQTSQALHIVTTAREYVSSNFAESVEESSWVLGNVELWIVILSK